MDWLRELPWEVFWWGWAMVGLLAGGAFYAAWWARRNIKAIGGQTPVDVADLTGGYRLAWGKTVGPALTAPLTGRPCVWWKAEVWESVREKDASGTFAHVWRQITREESDRPLLFGDARAMAAVWAHGATVVPSGWSDWRGQDLPPEVRAPKLKTGGAPGQGISHDVQGTFGPRFRYIEQIIALDAPVFAMGKVVRNDPALYTAAKAEDDDAEGDEDGSEAEDGKSWHPEPSRLGVLPTDDRVIDADLARVAWSISAPNRKPFLLSTEHPKAVSAEQELGAKGGMIMGALFTALAAALIWLRYGS